jgi:hypothetical protein
VATPEWSYELLRPAEQMEIDLVGSAVEGGRGLSGIGGAINTSGGGFWQVKLAVDLFEKAEHRFWNKLSGILSGGVQIRHRSVSHGLDGSFRCRRRWRADR